MVKTEFLQSIKCFTKDAVKDMMLPTRIQSANEEQGFRPAEVFLMRMPDMKAPGKKAPYILHQIVTAEDVQPSGERDSSTLQMRSVFCVYSDDDQEGGMMLLELMERWRVALLRTRVLDRRFLLDLSVGGIQQIIYPDDTAPYFLGEMISTWTMPAVQRDIRPALE